MAQCPSAPGPVRAPMKAAGKAMLEVVLLGEEDQVGQGLAAGRPCLLGLDLKHLPFSPSCYV